MMTFDQLHETLLRHVGKRARVTSLTGAGREATHDPGLIGTWREYPTIGGKLVGGEYDPPVRVEIMQDNGRYAEVSC